MKIKEFRVVSSETTYTRLVPTETYQLHPVVVKNTDYPYKITKNGEYIGLGYIVNEFNEYIHVLKLNTGKNKIELYRFYFIEDESKIFKNCLKTTLPNKVYIGPRGGKYIIKKDRKIYV